MIGYGTWGLGGIEYGPLAKSKALKLLNFSLNNGINFFDTAPLYGRGKVLNIIGQFIKNKKRKKFILCSKCGMKPHKGFKMKQDFSEKFLINDCMTTLRSLNTSYLDIMLLHSPDLKKININSAIKSLLVLKKKKLVKKIGVSVRAPSDIVTLKKYFRFIDYIEFNFNLLDQRAIEKDIFKILKNNKIKSICRTPMGFGFLSNRDINKKNLSKGDHRLNWSSKQFKNWNFFKKFFSYYQIKYKLENLSDLALLFCMSHNFEYVIPGMMSFSDIKKNINVSRLKKIENKDLEELFLIYKMFDEKIFVQKRIRS